ncbi:MAG: hypothetical protein ACXWKQ_04120 [Reyranella sp.]
MAPILLALVTGAFIGSYTIVDGLGARAAGSAHGYTIWLSLITALLTVCCVSWLQRDRRTALNPRSRNAGIAAGITGYGSTWVVIWALAPLAMVSAPARNRNCFCRHHRRRVPERNGWGRPRLASIALTLVGTTLLKLNR